MAGFLASFFRTKTSENPDVLPGIGGYTDGRGPAGQSGYPGSTSATRTNPRNAWKNLRRGTPYTGIQAQQEHRQDQAGEFHGGLPFQDALSATGVGPQYQDTEERTHPVISSGIPGGLRQRNTSYYGGVKARPDGVNRFVFGGPNGGVQSYALERRMPYTGRGSGARGADLNGNRYYGPPPVMVPQRDGFGKARNSKLHRPTVFAEPAPWSANYYDTTAATGSPDSPGTPDTVQNVFVSPVAERGRTWRRGG